MESTIVSRILEIENTYDAIVLSRNSALKRAEEYSASQIKKIREYIESNPPPATVHGLAVAGSLARHEASSLSDLDLIVTTDELAPDTEREVHAAIDAWRFALCDEFEMERHNPRGVFARPVQYSQLSGIAGDADENYGNVAKRILFVLELKWLFNQDNYHRQLDSIVENYANDIKADTRKNFVFLLNDVVRFFRALCVNYQFTKSETDDGKWPIRNIKLRHSRVIMYFSMVAAIGSLSREHSEQKIEALRKLIDMPPLKRLFVCYGLAGDGAFYKVAGFYNTFLSLLSNATIRQGLKNLEYTGRYQSDPFAQLKANSDAFSSELLRFYEARRGSWDDRFFEYMII